MPIPVICSGCHKRFQVSDKFAGQQGPCPHCKAIITIPKLEEEVVIHAPEDYGPVGTSGQAVLRPIKRRVTKLSPPLLVGSSLALVLVPLLAYLVGYVYSSGESERAVPWWLLGTGALAVAPPLVAAGYSFLRNAELEPYVGTALWTRVLICSVVYAALWAGELYLKIMLLDEGQTPELFHLLMIVPGLIIPGALAAMATLDLDGLSAAIHYAFYLAVTVFLRWCAGLDFF